MVWACAAKCLVTLHISAPVASHPYVPRIIIACDCDHGAETPVRPAKAKLLPIATMHRLLASCGLARTSVW